jgi:hypothetical protein
MACGSVLLCVSAVLATRLVAPVPIQVQSADPPDAYARSVALLKLTYPELAGQGLMVSVKGDGWKEFDNALVPLRGMEITVARPVPNSHDAPVPLLSALILWSNEPHTLFSLRASGEFVDDRRQPEARKFTHVDVNRIPSTAEVLAKLADLKARFVSETAIRDRAYHQLARLAPLLGKIEMGEVGLSVDGPSWHVTAFISTPTGRREYGVLFEPFEGRLIAMYGLR